MNIYLAGKTRTGWRDCLFDTKLKREWKQFDYTLKGIAAGLHYDGKMGWPTVVRGIKIQLPNVSSDLSAKGGTFIADYCGAGFIDVREGTKERKEHVKNIVADMCEYSIKRCDMVFAWIETEDCFGTILEIGYAKALGKPIIIGGPKDFDEMWLVYNWAKHKVIAPDAATALATAIVHIGKKGP